MLYVMCLLLSAGLGVVTAAKANSSLEEKPDKYKNIPGCYIVELDSVLEVGKEETSADCVLYRCEESWVDYYTCDLNMATPECKMLSSPDRSKPYPDCCPVFECYEFDLKPNK